METMIINHFHQKLKQVYMKFIIIWIFIKRNKKVENKSIEDKILKTSNFKKFIF